MTRIGVAAVGMEISGWALDTEVELRGFNFFYSMIRYEIPGALRT